MIKRAREFAGMIASFEIWVVGCAVAASFVYSRALPLAVGAAICFWLLRGFAYRRLSVRTPAA
jgi:hypothetical protein